VSAMLTKMGAPPMAIAATTILVVLVALYMHWALSANKKPLGPKFLNKKRQSLKIGERTALSHDTVRYRLLLPLETPVLGLPVGKHFKIFCPNPSGKEAGKWNGREDPEDGEDEIERKYTPCTSDDQIGYVDLVIKTYKGGVIDRFPDGGKMSQYLDTRKVGDTIDVSGPWGTHEYVGRGKMMSGKKEHKFKKLGMMAGGTGITPMLQVMQAILKDPRDSTVISLLYANQTEDDILVRDYLEGLKAEHPKRLNLWYTVDRPKEGWTYSSGFITAEMISEHLPPAAPDTLVIMCGPPPMVEHACKKNLDKLGFKREQMIAF